MNEFKDKLIRIYEKSWNAINIPFHVKYYYQQIEIRSEYYCDSFALPCNIDSGKLLEKETYDPTIQDFLDGEYYFILRNLEDEKIDEIVNAIPNNIPIIVDSALNFFDRSNVFYSILGEIDVSVLYNLLVSNRTFCDPSCYKIVIKNINDHVLSMLKVIENMVNDYVLEIYINDVSSLLRLSELLCKREKHPTSVTFSDNLFWSEELNPYSARYLLGNAEVIKELESLALTNFKLSFKYLEIYEFDKIINFERIVDALISIVPSEACDLDRVTFVILFIVNNFKTNVKISNLYDLLKYGAGACSEFSGLVKVLLNHLGLKCEVVGGQNRSGWKKPGHVWNVVTIDEEECFLDVTWIVNEFETGKIQSIEESLNYLTNNFCFLLFHRDYMDNVANVCKYYYREKIKKSIARVSCWESISLDAIKNYVLEKNNGVKR